MIRCRKVAANYAMIPSNLDHRYKSVREKVVTCVLNPSASELARMIRDNPNQERELTRQMVDADFSGLSEDD